MSRCISTAESTRGSGRTAGWRPGHGAAQRRHLGDQPQLRALRRSRDRAALSLRHIPCPRSSSSTMDRPMTPASGSSAGQDEVELIFKENGGQASALNAGIAQLPRGHHHAARCRRCAQAGSGREGGASLCRRPGPRKGPVPHGVRRPSGRPTGRTKPTGHLAAPTGDQTEAELPSPSTSHGCRVAARHFERARSATHHADPGDRVPRGRRRLVRRPPDGLLGMAGLIDETCVEYRVHGAERLRAGRGAVGPRPDHGEHPLCGGHHRAPLAPRRRARAGAPGPDPLRVRRRQPADLAQAREAAATPIPRIGFRPRRSMAFALRVAASMCRSRCVCSSAHGCLRSPLRPEGLS